MSSHQTWTTVFCMTMASEEVGKVPESILPYCRGRDTEPPTIPSGMTLLATNGLILLDPYWKTNSKIFRGLRPII